VRPTLGRLPLGAPNEEKLAMIRLRQFAVSALMIVAACGGGTLHPVPARPIAMNSELSATLTASDPQLAEHGSYHVYAFTGTAGQNIQIDVMSSEFDAFTIMQNTLGVTLATANAGGNGNDARIAYVLSADGDYRITATSSRPGGVGNYRIRLTTLAGVRVIAVGRVATGQLQPSDQRLPDNFLYQSYLYNARAGETVTIDAMSAAFDAYLIIQDAGGARIASDDNSGEGRNARLTFTFPFAGAFRILVGTYDANRGGAYSLSVR
jgi:hypothetical protein